MFRWIIDLFSEDGRDTKSVIVNNYKIEDNDYIKIEVQKDTWLSGTSRIKDISIDRSLIVSHTENSIAFKSYKNYFNFEPRIVYGICYDDNESDSIERKENLVQYKEEQIHTYEYSKEEKYWKFAKKEITGAEIISQETPLEIFVNQWNCKYKLIETIDEFNEYMASALDCNTWCRKKLYDKMKELGLGDGFINQFADLVGNDLDKYYAMIDLANEVSDKDTLMYLYTYKFRQN